MKKIIAFCFLALMVVFAPNSFAGTGLWDASIIYSDATTINLAWDPGGTCPAGYICGYNVELRHLESAFIDAYKVTTTTCTATYKRSGHYELFVRFWQTKDNINFTYSAWSQSSKGGEVVIGVPAPVLNKGWYLYWRLPAPTGGGVQ